MSDQTISHLYRLDPRLQPIAYEFISALRQWGADVVITSSTRTYAEQVRLVAMGRSKTYKSKHLAGKAFDIDVYGLDRNDIPRWFWDAVGPFGESLGLRWGGRWKSPYDPGHFELPL